MYFGVADLHLDEPGLREFAAQMVPPHVPAGAVEELLAAYPLATFPQTRCCTPHYWAAMRMDSDWKFTCPARRAARWLSSTGNVALYMFAHRTDQGMPPAPFEFTPHASERAYVFRDTPLWSVPDTGAAALAATFGQWWTNMARQGSPGVASGQPAWPAYQNETDLLEIGSRIFFYFVVC